MSSATVTRGTIPLGPTVIAPRPAPPPPQVSPYRYVPSDPQPVRTSIESTRWLAKNKPDALIALKHTVSVLDVENHRAKAGLAAGEQPARMMRVIDDCQLRRETYVANARALAKESKSKLDLPEAPLVPSELASVLRRTRAGSDFMGQLATDIQDERSKVDAIDRELEGVGRTVETPDGLQYLANGPDLGGVEGKRFRDTAEQLRSQYMRLNPSAEASLTNRPADVGAVSFWTPAIWTKIQTLRGSYLARFWLDALVDRVETLFASRRAASQSIDSFEALKTSSIADSAAKIRAAIDASGGPAAVESQIRDALLETAWWYQPHSRYSELVSSRSRAEQLAEKIQGYSPDSPLAKNLEAERQAKLQAATAIQDAINTARRSEIALMVSNALEGKGTDRMAIEKIARKTPEAFASPTFAADLAGAEFNRVLLSAVARTQVAQTS